MEQQNIKPTGEIKLTGSSNSISGPCTYALGLDEEGNIMEYEISSNSTFNQYQEFVKSMKVYPEKHAIIYPALGIAGEAGEVAEKVKKWLRGDRELDKLELLKEAGDVLWYLTSLADDLGYTLQDLVNENVKKLTSRKERDVVKGNGDSR
jgi:NTP pyrophosphatase (non-canonical NTP hydrolase)